MTRKELYLTNKIKTMERHKLLRVMKMMSRMNIRENSSMTGSKR